LNYFNFTYFFKPYCQKTKVKKVIDILTSKFYNQQQLAPRQVKQELAEALENQLV